MKNILETQITVRQIVGTTLVLGSGAYLFFALLMYAISTSTYM